MKKIDKKNMIMFSVMFLFTLLVFYQFITMHYATDTYNIINRGYQEYAIKYSLNDGRPFMCIISLLANRLHIPIQAYIIGLTVLALFLSCITIMILKEFIIRNKKTEGLVSEILVLILAYCTIFNFAFLENMQFAECAVMSMSILLYTIAAKKIVENEIYIFPFFLIIIATLCYQGTIGWLIIITFLMNIVKHQKFDKKGIKKLMIVGFFGILSVGVNLLQVRICGKIFDMQQYRMGGFQNISQNLRIICQNIIPIFVHTFGLFPKRLFLLFLAIILLICLVDSRKRNMQFLEIMCLVLMSSLISFVPNMFTMAAFGTGRISFSLGATLGVLLIYLYCNTDIFQEDNFMQKVMIMITITYIGTILLNYFEIMRQHKVVNLLDKENCSKIAVWFDEYEKQSETELKNIVVVYDSNPELYYLETENQSALCYRALYTNWSHVGVINYYTNRQLKWIENVQDQYVFYLSHKDWKNLDREQFVFVGDTVYYCVY